MGGMKEAYYAVVDKGFLPIDEEEVIGWGVAGVVKCIPHYSRHADREGILFGLSPEDAWEVIAEDCGEIARNVIDRLIEAGLPESDPTRSLVSRCCERLEGGLPLPLDYDRLDAPAAAGHPEAIHLLDKLHAEIRAGVEPGTDLSPIERRQDIEESLVRRGII